jgi:nucleotide-binding universal stress UspA family protein
LLYDFIERSLIVWRRAAYQVNKASGVSMTTKMPARKTKKITSLHLSTAPLHLKRILFATDFSSQAATAFELAAQLSEHFGSRLYMMHVISPMLYAAGNGGVIAPALQKVEIKRATENMEAYFSRMPAMAALKHEEIVTCGAAKDLIQSAVKEKGIDLLVMGSHGHSGIGKLALGSVAESALRHLRCPVLICGPECKRLCIPFKSILLATDLSIGSLRSAQYAVTLVEEFHAQLTIVHVVPTDSTKSDSIHGGARDQEVAKIDELVPAVGKLREHTQYSIPSGKCAPELLEIAELVDANLIVMGAREGKTLVDHAPWATISRVIHDAQCPVLAVQPHFG